MRDNFLNYDPLSLLMVRKRLGDQPLLLDLLNLRYCMPCLFVLIKV